MTRAGREQTETASAANVLRGAALLKADRERMASLEQLLEQREHELEEKTASLMQLRAGSARQTETSMTAANASLSRRRRS